MKAHQARLGRTFILRLEDNDTIPDCIEEFAAGQSIQAGLCAFIGGIAGGRLVVGPREADALPPDPMKLDIPGVHEAAALGTIFPNEAGKPVLHMHAAMGRGDQTKVGCTREGIQIWVIGEVILLEILDHDFSRCVDAATGFELLTPGDQKD